MQRDWSDREPIDPRHERRLRRWFAVFVIVQLLAVAAIAWPVVIKTLAAIRAA